MFNSEHSCQNGEQADKQALILMTRELSLVRVLFSAMLVAILTIVRFDSVLAQSVAADLSNRQKGSNSGLPVPRFVSLKADAVNVRRGPGWDYEIAWVYRRAGLPVEIIAESDVWRQVRDSDGATGWILGTLLSGRRTVLIAPWEKRNRIVEMRRSASDSAAVKVKLAPGVLGNIDDCEGTWCEISIGSASGYVEQDRLWGVYPGEAVN